jgi:hypothetical protein
MKTHISYVAIIIVLLIVIGVQTIPFFLEEKVTIRAQDDASTYTLRMLPSGDLIFEENHQLPLASFRDYWGDMTVSEVNWIDSGTVSISMSDGTKIRIDIGKIEISNPDK